MKAELKDIELQIRKSYAFRDSSGKASLYAWNCEDALYMEYRKRTAWLKAFKSARFNDLLDLEILDVGCGSGGWLRMIAEWGARPSCLHGVDLLEDRINAASKISSPNIDFQIGSGWSLVFSNFSMDVCAASTVFSSILDSDARLALAREMVRVLKGNGWAMIFDYAISSPKNPDTTGINKKEILRLFGDLELFRTYYLTLAPPLLRFLSPRLLWLAHALEALIPLLCTHRLYVLHKK